VRILREQIKNNPAMLKIWKEWYKTPFQLWTERRKNLQNKTKPQLENSTQKNDNK